MTRAARLLSIAGVALAAAGPAAAQETRSPLAASVVVDSFAAPGPNDPGRCIACSFLSWKRVPGASRYEVAADPPPTGAAPIRRIVTERTGAPPLPTTLTWGPAVFSWAGSEVRIPLSSLSTGKGCGEAEGSLVHAWTVASATVVTRARAVPVRQRRTTLPGSRDGRRQKGYIAVPLGAYVVVTWSGPAPRFAVDGEPFEVSGRRHQFEPREWDRMTVATGPDTRLRLSASRGGGDPVILKVGPKATVMVRTSPVRTERQPYFSGPDFLPPYLK